MIISVVVPCNLTSCNPIQLTGMLAGRPRDPTDRRQWSPGRGGTQRTNGSLELLEVVRDPPFDDFLFLLTRLRDLGRVSLFLLTIPSVRSHTGRSEQWCEWHGHMTSPTRCWSPSTPPPVGQRRDGNANKTNERTNKRSHERTNERTHARTHEPSWERADPNGVRLSAS